MKVLAIKQPWASLIAEGKKTIEVRSRPTNIRERVAIYAARSLYDERGFIYGMHGLPRGYIIATAEMVDCVEYEGGLSFLGEDEQHMIPCNANTDIDAYEGHYAWHLSNVKKLELPIHYKMPKGCVVWANYEGEL